MPQAQIEENDDEYGEEPPFSFRYPLKYNWETHVWECGCKTFQFRGRCRHAVRLRREELVEVNERFL